MRAQFILDADRRAAKDVQIGDAELTEYLVRQAARYQMPPQEFANQIMQAGNLPALVADVRRNKALAGAAGVGDDHRRLGQHGRPVRAVARARSPSDRGRRRGARRLTTTTITRVTTTITRVTTHDSPSTDRDATADSSTP